MTCRSGSIGKDEATAADSTPGCDWMFSSRRRLRHHETGRRFILGPVQVERRRQIRAAPRIPVSTRCNCRKLRNISPAADQQHERKRHLRGDQNAPRQVAAAFAAGRAAPFLQARGYVCRAYRAAIDPTDERRDGSAKACETRPHPSIPISRARGVYCRKLDQQLIGAPAKSNPTPAASERPG